jgi:hypothetical protein
LGNLWPDAHKDDAAAKQRCRPRNLDQGVGNLCVNHRYTGNVQQHGLRLEHTRLLATDPEEVQEELGGSAWEAAIMSFLLFAG